MGRRNFYKIFSTPPFCSTHRLIGREGWRKFYPPILTSHAQSRWVVPGSSPPFHTLTSYSRSYVWKGGLEPGSIPVRDATHRRWVLSVISCSSIEDGYSVTKRIFAHTLSRMSYRYEQISSWLHYEQEMTERCQNQIKDGIGLEVTST